MKKSKFFRVAVAGATTDGRIIEAAWIQQMAKNYNPDTYTALGNLEHFRGIAPDSVFGSYAKVTALKAEEIDINGQKKLALFAQVDAFDSLIELHKKGQKLFTSIEVNPSFADTNEAYLVGLAFTDTPASLGTQLMEFSAKNPTENPFSNKKQHEANLFTAADETSIELEDAVPDVASFFSKVMDWMKPQQEEQDNKNKGQFTEIQKSVEEIAKTFGATLTELNSLKTNYLKLSEEHGSLKTDFNELKTKLGEEPSPDTPPAPENTGNFSEQINC